MDFFDTTPSKSLPSDKKKATASKSNTKQVSSDPVDLFTASSGSGPAATVTPEKSGGFLRLPKPSKKKTPPRVREDASAAASSRTERVSAVSVSTLSHLVVLLNLPEPFRSLVREHRYHNKSLCLPLFIFISMMV